MIFTAGDNHMLLPAQDFPAGINNYPVPGSQANAFLNNDGQIVIQELSYPSCNVQHCVYRMKNKTRIQAKGEGPLLFLCIALKEDLSLEVEGIGKMEIKEGQFNLIYSPVNDFTLRLSAGKEYVVLNLHYQQVALQEMSVYFPNLLDFLERVQQGKAAILQNIFPWITREIQEAIYSVLHCPVDVYSYPVLIDLLTRTLLFYLLLQSNKQQPSSNYSHYEIDGIYAARDMIRKNIRYHFVIRELAQKVGLNEGKLKLGFKEMFGNGVYEYLQTERMAEARNLLLERGRNIKEIAILTGYKSVNSFIKAFKKKYNQTPGEFRKQASPNAA